MTMRIDVGMKIVGNWGAGHSYSYGVVTDVYHFQGRNHVVVDFDDLDGQSLFNENEFLLADTIGKIGVYVDHEGMVY